MKHTPTTSLLRSAALAMLAAAITTFTGCDKKSAESSGTQSSGAGGKKLTVGFAQVGAESDWRVAET